MAKLLPLACHPRMGQLVLSPRPHTAPSTTISSSMGGQTWIHRDRGRQLTMRQVEPLIHGGLANIKSAFMAADPDGTGLVSKEEFRRVLESLRCVSRELLDALLSEVCERAAETVDYMQFVRSIRRAPAAHRASSVREELAQGHPGTLQQHYTCAVVSTLGNRSGLPQIKKAMSISMFTEMKAPIGGNLRTVIRAFQLFDYNREGHIQQQEFRRILDSYFLHLTDKEFQRLWNHYSPNNKSTISYEHFLEKLGFGDSHNFKIAPVCTKIEVSSRATTPSEKIKQRKQRAESLSSSCDTPSDLPHRKLQSLFYDKMCMNCTPMWEALQAFDITHSGLVKQDALRAVLSSFIFPMNPHSFQKLTSRYGVKATGPVRWKRFLGHFMSQLREEGNTVLHCDRVFMQPDPDKYNSNIRASEQHIYPGLKKIFHLLDTKEAGWITRVDLRHLLERPGGNQKETTLPRLRRTQITELLQALDPEHTGVIQLACLEKLNPDITSASSGATAPPPSPAEETGHSAEQQKTPDEKQTSQADNKASVASASRRAVENLLLDKLCVRLSSVLAALKRCDPQHTGYVTQEDLRRVFSCYSMPISDTHFNKLCESFSSRPGLVSYTDFLRNLKAPRTEETHSPLMQEEGNDTESPQTPPQSTPTGQPPRPRLQLGPDTRNILDIVFQRMRRRLGQRHTSLAARIQAVTHGSDGTLSEEDVRKILEDSWVMLDDNNFQEFTELLGFRDGRMECSVFLAKYEEARDRKQTSEGQTDPLHSPFTSAEESLAAMKSRIKSIHGDNLTAFRLMDTRRKGVVDCRDFKVLHRTLGLFCRDEEYQRLLDLMGLHPGGSLNYAEFVDVVENNGKRKRGTQTASVQEQLHELLAGEAPYKWADMSKVLCQLDTDGRGWIHKKSLRELLFTYALPLTPDEFDQLWSRYDPQCQGRVAVCDFLEQLGFHPEGELTPRSQRLNQTGAQQDADRALSSDAAALDCVQLNVSMDENCERLAYMDFLCAFDQRAEKKPERPPASHDAVRQTESLDSLSPKAALARMQQLVTASAPDLCKAFLAFDQSRTGTVSALEFRQVLHTFCACLSDKQYRHMLTKLELDCKNCTVNWKDFLNKCQTQRTLMSSEQETKSRSPIQTKTSAIPEPLQQLQEVSRSGLYEIKDPSDSTKHHIRQLFDRRCPTLADDQFECVWRQMPANEQKKRFAVRGRTPNSNVPSPSPEPRGIISATKLCCPEISGAALQRTQSAPQCASGRPGPAGRPGTGSLLGSTERRLRGAVRRCWRDIQRKCAEEDPQQEGRIRTTSFLEILQSLSISVSREQFERLAVKSDIMTDGCVSYHNFLRHFLLNLEPAEETQTFERRELPLPITPTSCGVLSRDCVEVMLRICDVVRSSWTSVRRCFLASDPNRAGSVSVQDFRKVLRHLGVNLSSEEFFHLSSYFDGNTSGKIWYNNFLWTFLH